MRDVAEQVEQLFEPFSNSTTGGTGLGLSIVYQIVREHNGVINVRSLEGEGSTITLELPTNIKAMTISAESIENENVQQTGILEGFLTVKEKEIENSS